MVLTHKTFKQQANLQLIMAWMAFYANMARFVQIKMAMMQQKKLKGKFKKHLRIKKRQKKLKLADHGLFAQKTSKSRGRPLNLSYTKDRS